MAANTERLCFWGAEPDKQHPVPEGMCLLTAREYHPSHAGSGLKFYLGLQH